MGENSQRWKARPRRLRRLRCGLDFARNDKGENCRGLNVLVRDGEDRRFEELPLIGLFFVSRLALIPKVKGIGENDVAENLMRSVVRDVDGRIRLKIGSDVPRNS